MCKADLTLEATLNAATIFPAARLSIMDYDHNTDLLEFLPGEVFLQSMADKLKQVVGESPSTYKADGIIRLKDAHNLDLVLFETSGALSRGSKRKKTFDFYKGMFGVISMIKSLADAYNFGSLKALSAVNIYFIHTRGK